MSSNLYFLRHGETTHSQTGGYCGVLDPELTSSGQAMAEAFAAKYQSVDWSAIFSSPMNRTMATARPLCEAVGIEPQVRDGLKELNFGEWEDLVPEAVQEKYGQDYIKWLTEPAWNPPTGGETAVQVASRASLVLAEIEEAYPDGNVLVVSHKSTIRIMLCNLLGIDLGRYRDRIKMPVSSVTLVNFSVHGPMLKQLGDRSHLSDELRDRHEA
ncbi:MAG: histidine phosphatase family protein [Cyanobacteria bacterium P01_F01_bin.42]